MTKNNPIAGYI